MKNNLLKQLRGYKYVNCEKLSDGTYEMGYFVYADYVYEIIELVIRDKIIQNYMEIHKQIKNKEIKDLTLDEVIAYFTFINRGERFCDGHIAKFLDNGIFLKLFERFLELCKD